MKIELELDKEETLGIVEVIMNLVEAKNATNRETIIGGTTEPDEERKMKLLEKIEKMTPGLKKSGYSNADIVEILKSSIFSRW